MIFRGFSMNEKFSTYENDEMYYFCALDMGNIKWNILLEGFYILSMKNYE